MMKKILLLFAIIAFNISFGQTPSWTWAKSTSSYMDGKNNNTAVDSDGNIYIVGDFVNSSASIAGITLINGSGANHSDSYIYKFTSAGILVWYKHISTSGTDTIGAVSTDSNGNVYIIGTIGDDVTLGTIALTRGTNPHFIAKLNSSGDYIWAVQATGVGEYYFYKDLKVDTLGNVFISGSSYGATFTFGTVSLSVDPESASLYNTRPFVLKLNSSGVSQWAKMGTSDEYNPFGINPNSLAVDNNGGVVVCGTFFHNSLHFGAITLTRSTQGGYYSDLFIVKYDADGNELWAHNAGSVSVPNTSFGKAVAIDSNNNIFIAGDFTNEMVIETTTLLGTSGSQFYLAKYTSDGILQWVKTPNYSNSYTSMNSLTTDSSGNVYAGGLTFSTSINFSNTVTLSNLSSVGSFFVTKYNGQGTPIWAKGVTNLNANMDISLDCRAENDLIVGGTFDTTSIQIGSTVLTKSSANHDVYVARLYAAPLSTEDFSSNTTLIYPNPVKNNLYTTGVKIQNYEVYSTLGTKITQGILEIGASIDCSALTSGVYLLNLTDNEGLSKTVKFVKE